MRRAVAVGLERVLRYLSDRRHHHVQEVCLRALYVYNAADCPSAIGSDN